MTVHDCAFHSAKILFEISEIPCAKWITYIPVVQTQPKPLRICLVYTVIVSRIQTSSTGDNSFVKLKGMFLV